MTYSISKYRSINLQVQHVMGKGNQVFGYNHSVQFLLKYAMNLLKHMVDNIIKVTSRYMYYFKCPVQIFIIVSIVQILHAFEATDRDWRKHLWCWMFKLN